MATKNQPSAPPPSAAPAGPLGLLPPWLVTILRPAALTLMAACLVLPLTQILGNVVPGLHAGLLLAALVLSALEAHLTHYLIRSRYISGAEVWRVRAIEFGFFFFVFKLAQIAVIGAPAEGWPRDPAALLLYLFDFEILVAMVGMIGMTLAIGDTLEDLDRVGEPAEMDKLYVAPLESLTDRFFLGGVAVVVLSGLARFGLEELFDLGRAPVTGLVANVLLYFVVGFLMLGQVRLALLATTWQAQGARVPKELGGRWLRYSLIFLAIAGLIAFALPTGYTAGALGVLSDLFIVIFSVMWTIVVILAGICLLPVSFLMSLLRSKEQGPLPLQDQFPLTPPPAILDQSLPAWVELARTILVWALVIGMMLYVLSAYLRDRPELLRAVRDLAPLRRLRQMWAALRHRLSGALAAVQAGPVAAWLRERFTPRPALPRLGYFRLGSASPREQVQYYYLSLLRRAGEYGFGRRSSQTPAEYHPVLQTNLPENPAEVQALTDAFIESRYSAHPVPPEQVQHVRAAWDGLRGALAKLKAQTRKERKPDG